jgi:hypothetical protein
VGDSTDYIATLFLFIVEPNEIRFVFPYRIIDEQN